MKRDDIYAEFHKLMRNAGPEGVTVEELARKFNRGHNHISKHMRDLIADGKAEYIGKKLTINIAGGRQMVPAYRLKGESRR